ncbi:MAG: hypothetical protein U0271_00320 [Polyangiaceae bacterium]
MASPKRAWSSDARAVALFGALVGLVLPGLCVAHERWVRRVYLPFDHAFFTTMSGLVAKLSIAAALAIAGAVSLWYVLALPLAERLRPHNAEDRDRERRLPLSRRIARRVLRFAIDAEEETSFMIVGERVAAAVFQRLPAAVLLLGAHEHWFIMPSFPLHGRFAVVMSVVSVALAIWVLAGVRLRELGIAFFAGFGWLIVAYGSAAVDAVPVLASAFYYLFAKSPKVINARQIAGVRVSLGVGFFLLGLINKIYHAELFISVGDAFPELVSGPQAWFPWLTRESWCFTTALGEMVFGLLLLLGLFDKITTLALVSIFGNFIIVFGWSEIVHLYPIAGFAVLFFHPSPGTVLDGLVFRAHVRLWHWSGHSASRALFPFAVLLVAVATGVLLMFTPLLLVIQVMPRM